MPTIFIMTLPVMGAGFIGDHVYLDSDIGASWKCHGRNVGGRLHRHVSSSCLSSSICLASPDQGAIFGTLSIGDSDAGINYGRTGVCHQIANRILMPTSVDCSDVRGYVRSLLIYGTYGRGLWTEQSKCIIMDDRNGSMGLAEDSAPFWTSSDEPLSSDKMRGSDKQPTRLAYGLEEAYARYGYESSEARQAEIEGMLDAQVGTMIKADEKERLIKLHLAFHHDQDQILAEMERNEIGSQEGMEALTAVRERYFIAIQELIGRERFVRIFGEDLESAVSEFSNLLDNETE
jgi:hypothetical protein